MLTHEFFNASLSKECMHWLLSDVTQFDTFKYKYNIFTTNKNADEILIQTNFVHG